MATIETQAAPTSTRGVIAVRFDRVYGRVTCYPDNEAAHLFASIAGTKTLSPAVITMARALGFKLAVEPFSLKMLEAYLGGVQS